MGGENISYNGPVSAPTAYLTMYKLHYNSILYTPDGNYLVVDVKNFYLNNLTKKDKYCRIALKLTPQEIIETYDLVDNRSDGYMYVRVEKGMYGLVQAGIIAHEALK